MQLFSNLPISASTVTLTGADLAAVSYRHVLEGRGGTAVRPSKKPSFNLVDIC